MSLVLVLAVVKAVVAPVVAPVAVVVPVATAAVAQCRHRSRRPVLLPWHQLLLRRRWRRWRLRQWRNALGTAGGTGLHTGRAGTGRNGGGSHCRAHVALARAPCERHLLRSCCRTVALARAA